ncbi:MAG: methionine--tRNA ligase [Acidobacteriota bacterium]|nr:methionine--tRNA ligase [Acidobacteriota bacterium]
MKFFLTTAIDFVNSRPHLGTAYEKITADIIARYRRLAGFETHFLMGNDEHSQNVFRKATEQGKDPLAYCDEMETVFRDVWKRLDVSFDDFIRTTDRKRQFPAVQKMAQACLDNGDVYEGAYEGFYCVGCEAFKQEKDLVDGNCPIHNTKPQWIREKNWFFRLSKYQQALLKLYEQQPNFIQPDIRRNEILRLVESGLEDISMSRAGQSWGIPVPFDPTSVVYVWFDALINYAAAVGYGWDDELFKKWWPANLHVVGKDITRFHCVIWPAMLMSAKVELPGQVFGHGWVYFKGERMSKTMGNIVDPLDAADRFGPDPLRLYLAKEIPYGGDGDFTWERFEEKYNADLANNLGNLVNRLASMTERYQAGRVTATGGGPLAGVAAESVAAYRSSMDLHALHEGAAAAFRLVSAANNYITETQPWSLAKDPAQAGRLNGVLADTAEAVRIAALMLSPIMPASSNEILRRLGDDRPQKGRRLDADGAWRASGERQILNAGALWPRIEADKGVVSVSDENPRAPQAPVAPVAPVVPVAPLAPGAPTPAPLAPEVPQAPLVPEAPGLITIDDFMKVHLKVAKVLAAEKVPKSQKLLKLKVDAGEAEPRTILAGIAESYEPEALIGKSVVIVANLAPRKMMGQESNGMVLAASPDGGAAIVLNAEPATPGTRVR